MKDIIIYFLETVVIGIICVCVLFLVFAGVKTIDEGQRAECTNNGGLIVEDTVGLYDGCIYPSDR